LRQNITGLPHWQEKMMVMILPVVIHDYNYAPKLTAKTERPKFIFTPPPG
jgi:hypothetical protein